MSPSSEAPTPRQLLYLRALAGRTGTTFTSPSTRAQASREIDRLTRLPREPRRGDHVEDDRVVYATAVHAEEVAGFGSSATWRMSPPPPARRKEPLEPTRHTLGGPERIPPFRARQPRRTAARTASPGAASPNDVIERLGGYPALGDGGQRDVVALVRPDASVLVLDCVTGTLEDALVVAHLAPDEPRGNARLLANMYLVDPTRGRCGSLAAHRADAPNPSETTAAAEAVPNTGVLADARGRTYSIREVAVEGLGLQLRWARCPNADRDEPLPEPVTLRDVVGALEAYDPAMAITSRALGRVRDERCVSTVRLRGELRRLVSSRIVLNRALREAVQRHLSTGSSMSEIAMRCGRVKRDAKGNESGETSWLGRRLGLLPEGGHSAPTPWVHSDVLALIARRGLGIAPREVEL